MDVALLSFPLLSQYRGHEMGLNAMTVTTSSPPPRDSNKPVAELIFRHKLRPGRDVSIPITPGFHREFGRVTIEELFGLQDQYISKHHFRCHCNLFDPDDGPEGRVPPMTYVQILSKNPAELCQSSTTCSSADSMVLRNGSTPFLLADGNILHLGLTVSIQYREVVPTTSFPEFVSQRILAKSQSFSKEYKIMDRILGSGTFGFVLLAVETSSNRQVACKVVPIRARPPPGNSLDQEYRELHHEQQLKREISILQSLDHPNIVRLEQVFQTSEHIFLIKELLPGGDLTSFVIVNGPLKEPCAISIIWQILNAVEYIHSKGIAHRDIKAENILLTSWRPGARVVLTDFGAAWLPPQTNSLSRRMFTDVGTHGYRAPEVRKHQGYTLAADIWSIGCLAIYLLKGDVGSGAENEVYSSQKAIEEREAALREVEGWRHVSQGAKEFIRVCQTLDPERRPSASKAMTHRWFTEPGYAVEMREACERAVEGWEPREEGGGGGEVMQVLGGLESGAKSKYFALPHSAPVGGVSGFHPKRGGNCRTEEEEETDDEDLPDASPIVPNTPI